MSDAETERAWIMVSGILVDPDRSSFSCADDGAIEFFDYRDRVPAYCTTRTVGLSLDGHHNGTGWLERVGLTVRRRYRWTREGAIR